MVIKSFKDISEIFLDGKEYGNLVLVLDLVFSNDEKHRDFTGLTIDNNLKVVINRGEIIEDKEDSIKDIKPWVVNFVLSSNGKSIL